MIQFEKHNDWEKLIVMGIATTMVATLMLTGIALWQSHRVENIAETETMQLASDPAEESIGTGIIAMLASQQEVLEERVASDSIAQDVLSRAGAVHSVKKPSSGR